jgi:hypothetical protein
MSSTTSDPRIASTTVVGGPPDLIGEELIRCEEVTIGGRSVHVPRAQPGVPEYVSVAHSEMRAEKLRPRLDENLDTRGAVAYQPDFGLVLEFRSSAGTAVASAIVGVEAFTNHHLARYCPPGDGIVRYGDKQYDLHALREIPLNERVGEVLPELYGKPRPTREKWWQTFRQIQGLAALTRHAIDEPTARGGLSGKKSLTQRLCDGEYSGAAAMMLDLFAYFEPNWIPSERLERLPPAPGGRD